MFLFHTPGLFAASFHPAPYPLQKENKFFISFLIEEGCVLKMEILTEFLFGSGHLKKQIWILIRLRI